MDGGYNIKPEYTRITTLVYRGTTPLYAKLRREQYGEIKFL